MDVLELLRKVGVSESDLAYFDSSYVFSPAFNRSRQVLTVFLRITKALPFAVYCRVKNAFETKLKGEVELSLSCEQGVSNVLDVFSYMQHFAQKNNYRIISELYPKEEEDGVYIHLPRRTLMEDEQIEVEQIRQFLIRCGMKAYIQNPSEKESSAHSTQPYAPFAESADDSFRRVKFDKEKCKYVPLSVLEQEAEDIYIEGQIVSVEYFTTRKETEIQTVVIHEGLDAFVCKRFEGRNCPKEVLHSIKENQWVRLYGYVRYDKYSNGNVMTIQHSEPIDAPAIRKDNAEIKRVELHAHTNKSEMDGVCACSDLIKRAYKWGHKAIAITDHMVVQAYPDAQNTHLAVIPKNEKGKPLRDSDFKVIYGIEMNMADDRAIIVYNCEPRPLYHATYVCFDLETTGLSSSYDEIIEFGAVKIQNGNEVARMQVFVKPEMTIPPLIEQKTNITNAMVQNAEPISVVIDRILDFIGDDILVAHNASFDLGFIQEALRKLNRKPITNPVIDTLPLSWVMFPERKRYALGYLVRGYKIEYDEEDAHRADYDAEV
ncbi:MAG: PHP domain-containing protein, partial [Erysipelotrichaceae bacterium]|nr:PHP domain-containing protein [Erysipelotrichaceae bacterium]